MIKPLVNIANAPLRDDGDGDGEQFVARLRRSLGGGMSSAKFSFVGRRDCPVGYFDGEE
jgi:hypothetical protein